MPYQESETCLPARIGLRIRAPQKTRGGIKAVESRQIPRMDSPRLRHDAAGGHQLQGEGVTQGGSQLRKPRSKGANSKGNRRKKVLPGTYQVGASPGVAVPVIGPSESLIQVGRHLGKAGRHRMSKGCPLFSNWINGPGP